MPRLLALIVAFWLADTADCSAHLVTTGVGPFYDGIVHFFVSPMDVAVVIALCVLAALAGKAVRQVVLLLPLGWAIGIFVGSMASLQVNPELPVALCMLVVGGLAAANPRQPNWLPPLLTVVCALILGFFNGLSIHETNTSWLAGAGIVVAIGFVTANLCALVIGLQKNWQQVVARVIVSWIAATGLLVTAWNLHPPESS